MAYIPFQTEKADYIFYGSNHIYGRIRPDIFDGIDAMVVEGRDDSKTIWKGTWEERSLFTSVLGNRDLTSKLRKESIPIYEVDVNAKRSINPAIGMVLMPIFIIDLLVNITYSFSNSKLPNMAHQYSSLVERMESDSKCLGRSVVAAKKIDEYVTSKVSEEIGNRRPKIGIIYGAAHQMIIDFLMSEELREKFLAKYQKSAFESFDRDKLDLVLKFQYDKSRGVWVPEEHKARLFNKQ